jgi:branched-chain amino acid transport system permease protein
MSQYLVNGLMLGGIYGLMAVAYSLVYGVLGLVNFAFGEIFMLAAFATLFLISGSAVLLGDEVELVSLGFGLALVCGVLVGGIAGVVVERIVYRPLRGAPILTLLIASIAASLLLRSSGQLLFGTGQQSFPDPLAGSAVRVLGADIQGIDLLIFAVGAGTMAVLTFVVDRTGIGRGIRAVAQDRETARLMGIRVDRVVTTTFLIGSMLAGLVGVLYAAKYEFTNATMGFLPGLKALVAAVLGGIGSIPGAFLGGITIGVIEALAGGYLPGGSAWSDVVAFLILGLVLWIRPQGLLGARALDRA